MTKMLSHAPLIACVNSHLMSLFHTFINRSSRMSKKLFEGKEHANIYAKYRPTYPDSIYKTILDFYENEKRDNCDFELAVDVGCGNGQSTRPLCSYFKHVVGYDVSKQQIAAAVKDIDNLSFKVGIGEDLSFLRNDSVDLITVAQAMHWMDVIVFYKEVTRVLKPGGVLAVYGYGNNILDDESAHREMFEFYRGLLGPYWDKLREHVDNCYRDFDLPFPGWKRIENESISISREMSIDSYVGYLSTWSAWQSYKIMHPGSDELNKLKDKLMEIYKSKCKESEPMVKVFFPGFMLIGRKPYQD